MKPLFILLICLGILMVIWHLWGRYVSRVEHPNMQVIRTYTNMNIVQMQPQIVATVRTSGEMASAPNQAFGLLAGYIFGDNQSADTIAMTAPVTTQAVPGDGEKIAMTAPVTSQEIAPGVYETSFIMPSKWTMDTLPLPNNDEVTLKELPAMTKAVRTFAGYAHQDTVARERSLFQSELSSESIERSGSPTLAQYNDPRTPPWMRRNELWVDVIGGL